MVNLLFKNVVLCRCNKVSKNGSGLISNKYLIGKHELNTKNLSLAGLVVILFLMLFCCFSCASTKDMIKDPLVTNTSLSVEEKFNSLGYPLVQINSIEAVFDGKEYLNKATNLISKAKESIVMSFFLASECDENAMIYEEIRKKAQEGVQIYLIVDGVWEGDQTESKNHMAPLFSLRNFGVNLLIYNPLSLTKIIDPVSLAMREHRKYIVIDSEEVILGGMNLNYMSTISSSEGQRDSMYFLHSPELAILISESFISFWKDSSYDKIDSLEEIISEKKVLSGFSSNIFNGEDNNEIKGVKENSKVLKGYFINQLCSDVQIPKLFGTLFYSAKEEIDILPLIPLTDSNMISMVKDAVSRGVIIKLVLPNDPRENMFSAGHYMVKDLIDAGINVYSEKENEKTKALLHEKLMIVDNRYVVIGSVNFNYRSMTLSNEIALVVDNAEFAAFMKSHFNQILDNTYEISREESLKWRNFSGWLNYIMTMVGG